MMNSNTTVNSNAASVATLYPQSFADMTPAISVNSEDSEDSDIVTFLNMQTSESRLDFDCNDAAVQNVFTHYHTEDELLSLTHNPDNDVISLTDNDVTQLFISLKSEA